MNRLYDLLDGNCTIDLSDGNNLGDNDGFFDVFEFGCFHCQRLERTT